LLANDVLSLNATSAEFVAQSSQAHIRRQQRSRRVFAAIAALMTVIASIAVYQWRIARTSEASELVARKAAEEDKKIAEVAQRNAEEAQTSAELAQGESESNVLVLESLQRVDQRPALGVAIAMEAFVVSGSPVLGREQALAQSVASFSPGQVDATTVEGHASWALGVAYSPDGTQLATTSEDQTIKLWDLETATNTTTLQGHTNMVPGVAYSPDGTQLATTSNDQTARLWQIRPTQKLCEEIQPFVSRAELEEIIRRLPTDCNGYGP
jgi:DNA-binding beta-propeller fold protein YncE